MTDFRTYYRQLFKSDLFKFLSSIPEKSKNHYSSSEITIQYFTLTPNYNYLDSISQDKHGLFTVSLFWTILVDQVCYTHFKSYYARFQQLTLYPKFIGNCTGTGFFTSDCGHHQHPKLILEAINNKYDEGNRFDFDREPFENDSIGALRKPIKFDKILLESIEVMKEELKDFFTNYLKTVDWKIFWSKCEYENPIRHQLHQ